MYARYGLWGEFSSGDTNEYSFTGKDRDSGTGLAYFGGRYYLPGIGRFTSVDPAKDGLNWYAYCRNNPLRYIDPDGLRVIEIIKGWTVRIENGHVPGDQRHIHIENKGNEVWNQNADGTQHHSNKCTNEPSKKIKKKIKKKTGWDLDKNDKSNDNDDDQDNNGQGQAGKDATQDATQKDKQQQNNQQQAQQTPQQTPGVTVSPVVVYVGAAVLVAVGVYVVITTGDPSTLQQGVQAFSY